MKKKIAYCILIIASVFSAKAQTWAPVASGIDGAAANTTWSLFAYDSALYAGGWFSTAGGAAVNDIAQWNSTNWSTMGTGTSGYINAMAYYNGNLYVGGQFDTIGGVVAHDIAMWNGTSWMPVGKGMRSVEYGVYCMAVYNGSLYAGGSFDSVDGKLVYGIAEWNGTTWSSLGSGVYAADEDDGVFAMAVYNGDLYVAGGFDSAGGVRTTSEAAKWNGINWSSIGGFTNGPIYALAAYNGNLYAGGWVDTIGNIATNAIAMWNGSNWSAVGAGLYGEPGGSQVNALTVYDGELYAGGYFDTVNGQLVNAIAKWNGTQWSTVGNSVGINIGGSIDAMTVYNNSLYVGGGFDSAGGVYAKNIAMWAMPTSVNKISDDNSISVYPNPVNKMLSLQATNLKGDLDYNIYNELGQQMECGIVNENKVHTFDVSSYPAGIYMISITAGTQRYSSKFIKN